MRERVTLSRRDFVRLSAGSGVVALLAACGVGEQAATPTPQVAAPTPLPPTATVAAVGGATEMGANAAGSEMALVPPGQMRVTPNDDFYSVDIGRGTPFIDPATYELRIKGAVEREVALTLDEIRAMDEAQPLMRTLECISNPVGGNLIGNAIWDVVPFAPLLARAGPRDGAVEVVVRAADGFHTSIPIDLARDPEAYLAFGMNGEPLPADHGFPLRVLWPGRYGMKQPRWITEIEVVTEPYTGYWEKQGWSNDAFIKVNSQIEQPANQEKIAIGTPTLISGRAMAGRSGIARVEVSTDNGQTWHDADLTQVEEELVWTLWSYDWQTSGLAPGRAIIQARATDGDGVVQEGVGSTLLGGTFPDGTSRIHAITVTLEA